MIADISDLHAFSTAALGHADDLRSAASDLTAAGVDADAFGPVGADFLVALNRALTLEASRLTRLADRVTAATSTASAIADAYQDAEGSAVQAIWRSRA